MNRGIRSMSTQLRHMKLQMLAMTFILMALASAGQALAADGLIADSNYPIETCEGKFLPPGVERLLKPVLLARAAAIRSNREWDTTYEKAFYNLLKMKGPEAREAQVALMAYYTGEHYGEELLENALAHRKQFDPLVRRYRRCRPRLTFEDQLSGVVVLQTLYKIYDDDFASEK